MHAGPGAPKPPPHGGTAHSQSLPTPSPAGGNPALHPLLLPLLPWHSDSTRCRQPGNGTRRQCHRSAAGSTLPLPRDKRHREAQGDATGEAPTAQFPLPGGSGAPARFAFPSSRRAASCLPTILPRLHLLGAQPGPTALPARVGSQPQPRAPGAAQINPPLGVRCTPPHLSSSNWPLWAMLQHRLSFAHLSQCPHTETPAGSGTFQDTVQVVGRPLHKEGDSTGRAGKRLKTGQDSGWMRKGLYPKTPGDPTVLSGRELRLHRAGTRVTPPVRSSLVQPSPCLSPPGPGTGLVCTCTYLSIQNQAS